MKLKKQLQWYTDLFPDSQSTFGTAENAAFIIFLISKTKHMQTTTLSPVALASFQTGAGKLPRGRYAFSPTISSRVLLLLGCLLFSGAVLAQTTYYVKANGNGSSGTSWAGAFGTLQQALAAAVNGDKIWVAEGVYHPTADAGGNTNPTDLRTKTFVMKNGVAIYGGFTGTETQLSQRNWKSHLTTLSGDFNGNDVVSGRGNTLSFSGNSENSYHVFLNFQNGLNSTALLDGFTITGGNANAGGFGEATQGAGMFNSNSSPAIANCNFSGNYAAFTGGGIMNLASSPAITNCSFSKNHALQGGGMTNNNSASPTMMNCIFSENHVDDSGGGMYSYLNCSPLLTNCTFSENYAFYTGGSMYNGVVSPTITNCIFWNNNSGITSSRSIVTITYSIVQNTFYSGENGNWDRDPLFVNAANGDLHLQGCSPAIDAGNNAANTSSTDLDRNARINHTTIDMGAYEYYGSLYSFYQDADHDNYGNPNISIQTFCSTAPVNYVSNNSDCNDANANEHPGQTWYRDADNDGYSDGTMQIQCGRPASHKLASELSAASVDCDDNNPNIHTAVTYYRDADGDGFGDPNTTTTLCSTTPSAGYVTNSNDCNDTKLLYADIDGDGYGSGAPVACGVANNTDCNDNNAAIHAPVTYYQDADSDGYGDLNRPTSVCSTTAPAGYVNNNQDCNDGDAGINPTTVWVLDQDNDGYYTGSSVTQCTLPATGYVIKTTQQPEDCDDNNANIHTPVTYYRDADEDGYGDLNNTVSVCTTVAPAGYVNNNNDCNDGNAAVNPATVWYLDADNDGYYTGSGVNSCTSPGAGYKYTGLLGGGDCNDNVATIHEPQIYYADNDGDGFGDPDNSTTVCTSMPPSGFVTDHTDCNDHLVMYQDNDGDSYGSNVKVACGGVANSKDCNDYDNTVYQGAIAGPAVPMQCYNSIGTYTVAALQTGKDCNVTGVSYLITGATNRSGSGSNASGAFGVGTSTITWTVLHSDGTSSTCQTTVVVNPQINISIPDAKALNSGVSVNTVYVGYVPASSLTLSAQASGGSGTLKFRWSNDATTQSIAVSPATTTTYTVTITDGSNCTGTASKTVGVVDVRCGNKMDKVAVCHGGGSSCIDKGSVSDHLSHGDMLGACTAVPLVTVKTSQAEIAQVQDLTKFSIAAYPNPSRQAFTLLIKGNDAANKISLRILDAVGRTVEVMTVAAGTNLQVGSGYRPGIYIVEAVQGKRQQVLKLVRQ